MINNLSTKKMHSLILSLVTVVKSIQNCYQKGSKVTLFPTVPYLLFFTEQVKHIFHVDERLLNHSTKETFAIEHYTLLCSTFIFQ